MRAALRREADRRGIFLSDEVMDYLLTRFARDLKHLMALLDRLDEFALASKRAITVPLLRADAGRRRRRGAAHERNLCLFDLDDTLLPLDSDHAWGEFMIRARLGRRAPSSGAATMRFYADYKAGRLDIHAYIEFATAPLRDRAARRRRAPRTPASCAR